MSDKLRKAIKIKKGMILDLTSIEDQSKINEVASNIKDTDQSVGNVKSREAESRVHQDTPQVKISLVNPTENPENSINE